MIRPMTSNVSALSGIVANGHQAIHFVSSAPSKIPYGGFSPVRLQAGCQRRPSSPNGDFDASTVEVWPARVWFRSRACAQAARAASDTTHRPSGPWLRQRLCCPPASSLTMAASELLRRSAGFIWYSRRTCCDAEGPHFYRAELEHVPPSLLRGLQRSRTNLDPWLGLRPFDKGSASLWPTPRTPCGDLTKLQRSHTAAARALARPAPDGTFTAELARAESLPRRVGHDYRNVRLIPDRTFTGCSARLVGCTSNPVE